MSCRSILIACLATLGLAVAGWGQADDKIAFLSDRGNYESPRDIYMGPGCVDYECGWERPREPNPRTVLR